MDQRQMGFPRLPRRNVVQGNRRIGRRQAIGLGLIVLAVLVIGGIIVAVAGNSGNSTGAGGTTDQTELSQEELQKAVEQANAKNDYQGAAQIVAQQRSASSGDAASGDKATELKLAIAYYNSGDYKKALEIYNQLNDAGNLDSGYVIAAAETAVKAGDKQAAIKYYQLAERRAQQENSPTAQAQVQSYERKIAELSK